MTRYTIYKKYLEDDTGFSIVHISCKHIGCVNYYLCKTVDTGVYFYKAKLNLTSIKNDKYTFRHGDKLRIKIDILSSIDEIPVISIENMIDLSDPVFDGLDVLVDLSGSDLGNIINMRDIHNNNMSNYAGVRLPNNKKLKPIDISRLFAYMQDIDIKREIQHIDLSEVANLEDLFMCSYIEDFDFSIVESNNIESVSGMFFMCNNLRTVKGVMHSKNTVKIGSMFYKCLGLESIDEGLFDMIRIDGIDELIFRCGSIKNIPRIAKHIGEEIDNYSILNAFNDTVLNLKMSEINNIIKAMVKYRYDCKRLFTNCSGSVNFGSIEATVEELGGILSYSEFDLVDLSGVRITNLDELSSDCDVVMELLIGQMSEVTDFSYFKAFAKGYAPKIIIIDKCLPITSIIRSKYTVVDFTDMTKSQVEAKLNLMTAIDNSDTKYIVVTDYSREK